MGGFAGRVFSSGLAFGYQSGASVLGDGFVLSASWPAGHVGFILTEPVHV